ncbi:hypothetical protein ACF1AB_24490 [Streptomyces sp. NPDC014846]|uniref:hypothetical protein n=1 Tax=unclassified Streptomyces TaxID=2593676 RepID=UPI0036FD916D
MRSARWAEAPWRMPGVRLLLQHELACLLRESDVTGEASPGERERLVGAPWSRGRETSEAARALAR